MQKLFTALFRWQHLALGAAALTLVGSQLTAQGLNVTVTGVIGSGQTTWTFSGGYTIRAHSTTNVSPTGNATSRVNFWAHDSSRPLSGELTRDADHHDRSVNFTTSQATVTRGSVVLPLTGVFLDSDGNEGGDDFAWLIDSFPSFGNGDTLSFSGSAVLPVDINTFGEGSNRITDGGDSFTVSSAGTTVSGLEFSQPVDDDFHRDNSGTVQYHCSR